MHVIPAIDLIDGQCVRLTQGDYQSKKVYSKDPLEVAKRFEDAGIRRLHIVDLDGAKAKHIINYPVLERIATHTNLLIDFGGGLKSDEDVRIAFAAGAHQITGGTVAVKNKALMLQWIEQYGGEKIILGADVSHERIAISGWQEQSDIQLFDFLADYVQDGIQYVICTDIAKDGMLNGPAVALYQKIIQRFPQLQLIASGGIAQVEDLRELKKIGCFGAITGKALYEGKISLDALKTI
ncbi:MAG: 1-(5-phosphoribosyl)-5-[(5-phosphoribosylamino)methylideneamino]imidazole-4-carboxamide isomerase [Bacteroidota bacterium]